MTDRTPIMSETADGWRIRFYACAVGTSLRLGRVIETCPKCGDPGERQPRTGNFTHAGNIRRAPSGRLTFRRTQWCRVTNKDLEDSDEEAIEQ